MWCQTTKWSFKAISWEKVHLNQIFTTFLNERPLFLWQNEVNGHGSYYDVWQTLKSFKALPWMKTSKRGLLTNTEPNIQQLQTADIKKALTWVHLSERDTVKMGHNLITRQDTVMVVCKPRLDMMVNWGTKFQSCSVDVMSLHPYFNHKFKHPKFAPKF